MWMSKLGHQGLAHFKALLRKNTWDLGNLINSYECCAFFRLYHDKDEETLNYDYIWLKHFKVENECRQPANTLQGVVTERLPSES